MSNMRFVDDGKIVQGRRDQTAELGYIGHEKQTGKFVLWLKDPEGIFGAKDGHIRGDEWDSLDEAKQRAIDSTSARLAHFMWLQSLKEKSPGA